MGKIDLTEDTIIVIGKSISLSQYRDYFQQATGKVLPGCGLMPWLNRQTGKTLKQATALYCRDRKCTETYKGYICRRAWEFQL